MVSVQFIDEYYSIVWMHHILFIQSWADRHLDCLQFWSIKNDAAMTICIQVSWWMYVFIYLG